MEPSQPIKLCYYPLVESKRGVARLCPDVSLLKYSLLNQFVTTRSKRPIELQLVHELQMETYLKVDWLLRGCRFVICK